MGAVNVAFYAPMKPPNHATPSGDRAMARALIQALSGCGQVDLVSELRVYDGVGDAGCQRVLERAAKDEAARLIASDAAQHWQVWISYHNYYKAPDIIGPLVSRALNIPYVLVESTRARKRLTGPWARFARLAEMASDHADLVFYFTVQDHGALADYAPAGQGLVHLRPFLSRDKLPDTALKTNNTILSVGMFRAGDKLASYEEIAQVLPLLQAGDWQLEIAGDGVMRDAVEALFAPFGAQVRLLGELDRAGLERAYGRAVVFLWPGVNEAFGMAYLEAQAAGVPVVAQDRAGVRDVVARAGLVPVDAGAAGMARAVDALLLSQDLHAVRGAEARDLVEDNHFLGAAQKTLWAAILPLI